MVRSGCEVATLNVAGLIKLAFIMLMLAGLISCVITWVLDLGDFPRGCLSPPRDFIIKLLSFDLGVVGVDSVSVCDGAFGGIVIVAVPVDDDEDDGVDGG